uniref:Fizzy and cell division cycle 20 related 1 n=1 Tax=Callithrix jacchus TaxID=9483 RepID=A0A8I3WYC9_CALJA
MDQDYERRLLRQIVIQNENTMPRVTEMRRTLTPASSPVSSPSKHGDRFIPSRAGANWSVNFHRINENEKSPSQNRKAKDATSDNGKDGLAYSALLKNELLGAGIEKVQDPQTEDRRLQPSTPEKKGLFTYSLSTKRSSPDDGNDVSPYSLSPVSNKSQKLLRSPRKPTRKISKIPFKVLDAPELQDDFYLNLVDWSSLNVLSVGLGTCVYLWSACTSQVTRLCDLSVEGDSVTSVGWSERGNLVAVGTHKGFVQIWDAAAGKKLSMLEGHTARVGALAWNADQLSSGSRDRMILQRDIRTPPLQSERRLQGHRQEVCGLKWSTDHQLLASGGNDNKVCTPRAWLLPEAAALTLAVTAEPRLGTGVGPTPQPSAGPQARPSCSASPVLEHAVTSMCPQESLREQQEGRGLGHQGRSSLLWGPAYGITGLEQPRPYSPCPPAAGLESLEPESCAAVHRAPGGREGHRLVPAPARPVGLGGRHGRPLHPLLEHADGAATAVH